MCIKGASLRARSRNHIPHIMNFRNQTQLVLLAVVAVCVQMCSGANMGEDGGLCKGPGGFPVPGTVCQADCEIVNLPLLTCHTGLTCCLLVSCPQSATDVFYAVMSAG